MAHLYNDANFTYSASTLTYNGVATYASTATGSGTGTATATWVRIKGRAATGSGAGTATANWNINPVRTATGSGTGTATATGKHVAPRTATASGTGASTATGLHNAPRYATGNGTGTSLTAIVVGRLRTGYGSGGATTGSTATGLHKALRTATGSGTGTSTSLGGILFIRTASATGAGTATASWAKSLIFRPPVEDRFPWADYRGQGANHRLYGYATQGRRARNIFRLTNGTYTNTDPRDQTLVSRTYYGGHEYFVTETEKAELVSAGYEVT